MFLYKVDIEFIVVLSDDTIPLNLIKFLFFFQVQNDPRDKNGYHMKAFQKHNEDLFEFYKRQQLIPEEEWDTFKNILKVSLPSSFRIQRSLP